MEKVYEELDDLKTANEKLRTESTTKTELLESLKKLQSKQSVEIQEARTTIEKQGIEIEEKAREVSELKRTNEDLQRCLRDKDCIVKRLNEANEKLRVNGEDKNREFEEEKRKLVSALDEASEKNIDMEQRINVYRAEIEGLKGVVAAAEKRKIEVEKSAKALRECRGRDDVMVEMEEEKIRVEEKLKWKKEQFKHLEEAYEKLQNVFNVSKKEMEEERSKLLDEIYSLQSKLDSQTRISEDLEKRLQMCNGLLTQEETRRKHLEVQVSEFKARYEDAFAEYQDARTRLDELAGKRDEEVAELRHMLSTKETYFKEMKYEKGKLEVENRELLVSLKELQEATIQGSGNTAVTKLRNKFRNLENVHKNCLVNLRSKEAEWRSQMGKMEEEIDGYEAKLQSKEEAVKEVETELENAYSLIGKMILEYEEISVMFLVLSRALSEAQPRIENVEDERIKDDKREEESYSVMVEQLEQKNVALAKAGIEIEEEREKVTSLLKRIEVFDLFEEENRRMGKEVERYKETLEESTKLQAQMKRKMEEAERDYEEKLLQVCDALDNTNSDLVAEREKVVGLTIQIESFSVVKEKSLVMEKEAEKYKEMLEESETRRVLLEEKISRVENDSKENIRELCSKVDIAYAKLAEEVKKNFSLIQKTESIDHIQRKLEEATKNQLLLQEKVVEVENDSKRKLVEVSEALETANNELSDKTSEAYQIEFQLWVWKSIAKRLKVELEQSQNLRKRVEASLLEQVGVGEAMREERNELNRRLNGISTENVAFLQMLTEVEKEFEFSKQESFTRELEDALFANHEREILAASKILNGVETEAKKLMIIELEKEISSISKKLESSEESVSCLKQEVSKSKQVSLERRNVVMELEKGMSKLCDDDTKLMKALEKAKQRCDDGFGGKENLNVCDSSSSSPRLVVMKHQEDVVAVEEEERSPFRQLNH